MWAETLGHSKQIAQLEQAIQEGKAHHAYLFAGIEGIGKKRVAIGFAQALNYVPGGDPLGASLSCRKIAAGHHPDCPRIEPAKNRIKIETVRQLKQKIFLHASEGKAKVVLIDKADTMTEAAANALLKILEEPPADTYFVLISSRSFRLLPTIRSRCQQIDFYPLRENEILPFLKRGGMPHPEATLRTAFSQGSPAAALRFDAPFFEETHAQVRTLSQDPKPSKILDLTQTWLKAEEQLPFILETLGHLWHQKILATEEGEGAEKLTEQWEEIQKALYGLERYANKQLLVESLLFKLTA